MNRAYIVERTFMAVFYRVLSNFIWATCHTTPSKHLHFIGPLLREKSKYIEEEEKWEDENNSVISLFCVDNGKKIGFHHNLISTRLAIILQVTVEKARISPSWSTLPRVILIWHWLRNQDSHSHVTNTLFTFLFPVGMAICYTIISMSCAIVWACDATWKYANQPQKVNSSFFLFLVLSVVLLPLVPLIYFYFLLFITKLIETLQ